jgi:hypothetical protein
VLITRGSALYGLARGTEAVLPRAGEAPPRGGKRLSDRPPQTQVVHSGGSRRARAPSSSVASAVMTPRWTPNPRSLHSRAELKSRGVHPRRLASDEFLEAVPGFLTPAAAPAPLAVVARVLQRKAVPGAVISHASAAELLALPLPFDEEYERSRTVHGAVLLGERRRSGRGAVMHTRSEGPTLRVEGLRVSAPVTLLRELAGTLDHAELVACCDHLVGPTSRVRPRMPLADLRRLVDEAAHRYRISAVRRAVADSRERVESPRETETRLLLQGAGFSEPAVNKSIRAPGTEEVFRLDLSYPELRLAIEYDGFWHSTDKKRHRADRRKDDVLHELGWKIVRASDEDLRNPRNFLGRIAHHGAPRR